MSAALRYRGRFGVTRSVSALAAAACLAGLPLVAGCASSNAATVPVGAGSSAVPSSVAPSSGTVMVKDDSNGKTVHVHVGSLVRLVLASSYWSVHGSSASAVLRQAGQSSLLPRPSNCAAIPGLGCQPEQTDFTAAAAGTATVTADRTSCGEAMACRPDQKHFAVTIVVQ